MEDVKKLALEAFEGREEAEKKRSKELLENLEDYVKKIIEIFKISNSSEKSKVLVWQVKLCSNENENCTFLLSFKEDGYEFYKKKVLESGGIRFGNNESLRKYIEDLKIPCGEVKNISRYFKENLSEYFETEDNTEDNNDECIIIKMRRKRIR